MVTDKINELLGVNDSYQAPSKLMNILYDRERREHIFKEMLDLFDYNVGYDWFHQYYQEEHAQRKTNKQDFTPYSVANLLTEITGSEPINPYETQSRLDVAAGTGGLTISQWDKDRKQHSPFSFRPCWYMYQCEELSDRSVPFLLFNLMIRGTNAIVIHGDTLTRKAKGAFFIQNDYDDHMHFSSLNLFPYDEQVERELSIKWDVKEEDKYKPILETPGIPSHVFDQIYVGEGDEEYRELLKLIAS